MEARELNYYDLQWCLRMCPAPVLELLKRHPGTLAVAGGYVRDCIAQERPHDIDLFSSTPELAKAYAQEFAGGPSRYIETLNAYTVLGRCSYSVQFIHRWAYANPVDLLASFDFTVAMAALWWGHPHTAEGGMGGATWRSAAHPDFYADLAAKRLIYTSPVRKEAAGGTMLRLLKFYQRGYRIPLDDLGQVIARLCAGVDLDKTPARWNQPADMGRILTGLLHEVDPALDPRHIAHLPSRVAAHEEVQ